MLDVWTKKLLSDLIRSAEEFYKDPENEKEFQEWLARRKREPKEEGDARPA
jgi:hypothetical protein